MPLTYADKPLIGSAKYEPNFDARSYQELMLIVTCVNCK